MKLVRCDAQVRRFMTVPGVGPITALAFKATIDDPARFARSRSVGAYVGLTCRRHASGEVDWSGQISKCGDAMLRSYLFEAAGVLSERPTAIATLNRQRHLTPSCGGLTPTAERTVGPARISKESLTSRSGIREQYRPGANSTPRQATSRRRQGIAQGHRLRCPARSTLGALIDDLMPIRRPRY